MTAAASSASSSGAEALAEAADSALKAKYPDAPLGGAAVWRMNATLSRKGIRFVGTLRDETRTAGAGMANGHMDASRPALTLPDKPSIAILPFTNMSGDREQEYFAEGIAEDIITELSRFSELFVTARNSSFQYKGKSVDVRLVGWELGMRYVLEGSIRRNGDRVRVGAQLVDTLTGAHRWAERYERRLEDAFAVQDEVVQTIAPVLVAHLNKAEVERMLLKPPSIWQAHDFYLKGSVTLAAYLSSYDGASCTRPASSSRSLLQSIGIMRAPMLICHLHTFQLG